MEERTIVSFDYAIKYLLRDKADFVILSGFLSELLGRKVEVTAILESESNKINPAEKTNRIDLKAQINNGEIAVFEIQFLRAVDFFGKVLYGVSRAVVEQVSVSKLYDIKKVYSINIAYHNLGAAREYLFTGKFGGFRGVNFEDESIPFAQTRGLAPESGFMADIHPEYYLILPEMFDERLRSRFDEWVYLLKNSAVRSDFAAAGIKEASVKLDFLNMPSAERAAYENFLENRASIDSVIHTALIDGRMEEKIEIAKNMKSDGMTADKIAKLTGLTLQEIEKF